MSAPVWKYFTKISDANCSNNRAKCTKCGSDVNNSRGSTSAMVNHMRNIHKICCKRTYNSDTNVSSPGLIEKSLQKTISGFIKKPSLGEIVEELATKDGFSIRGITRSNFIRQAISDKGFKLPKSENGIMTLIHAEYEKKKILYVKYFDEAKKKGEKFSITLDEWTSSRQRRYMNINVHDQTRNVFNLGLVRIVGSSNAEKVLLHVTDHLKAFHLSFENDIVATTNDGASVLVKYGRECPAELQLCLNHGIHLAVCETFYFKGQASSVQNSNSADANKYDSNEDDDFGSHNEDFSLSEDEETNSEVNVEIFSLAKILNKVRAIVKFFKYSTVRNDILQERISAELGKGLHLKMDVKHRWNSIHPMLESFLKLRKPIAEVLKELNATHLIQGINFEIVEKLCSIMEPILLTVHALSRKDANLITAKGAINFLLKKLDDIGVNNFANINELKENIKTRLRSRENPELNSLLSCLLQQKVPTKEILNFGTVLLKRLYPNLSTSAESNNSKEIFTEPSYITDYCDISTSLEDEINAAAQESGEKPFSSLGHEFAIYKKIGKKSTILQHLYDAILTIRPTSTESERVFSVSNNFCRKLRSRLSDHSLNALVFLKYYKINSS